MNSSGTLCAIQKYIKRLEVLISEDTSTSGNYARKLEKAVNRLRFLSESKMNFKDAQSFFKYANGRLKGGTSLPILKLNQTSAYTCSDKARILGSHFSTLYCQATTAAGNATQTSSRVPAFPDSAVIIQEAAVSNLLCDLEIKSSTTPDGLPPIFFKKFAIFLAEPLALIFSRLYNDGVVPDYFRRGAVTPVYKKGDKTCVENYRPVSQCSGPCLIFEKILVVHMTIFLEMNNLTDSAEHGFISGRSTCTQLLEMCQD